MEGNVLVGAENATIREPCAMHVGGRNKQQKKGARTTVSTSWYTIALRRCLLQNRLLPVLHSCIVMLLSESRTYLSYLTAVVHTNRQSRCFPLHSVL